MSADRVAIIAAPHCSSSDIHALTETSRLLRATLTPLLYKNIELNTPRATEVWGRLLVRNPEKASMISHLRIGRGAFSRISFPLGRTYGSRSQELTDPVLINIIRQIIVSAVNLASLEIMSVERFLLSDEDRLGESLRQAKVLQHLRAVGAGPLLARLLRGLHTLRSITIEWAHPKSLGLRQSPALEHALHRPSANLHHITVEGTRVFPPKDLDRIHFPNVSSLHLGTHLASGSALRRCFPSLSQLTLDNAVEVVDVEDWTVHSPLARLQCPATTMTSLVNIRATHLILVHPRSSRGRPIDGLFTAMQTADPRHLELHGWSAHVAAAAKATRPIHVLMKVLRIDDLQETVVRY